MHYVFTTELVQKAIWIFGALNQTGKTGSYMFICKMSNLLTVNLSLITSQIYSWMHASTSKKNLTVIRHDIAICASVIFLKNVVRNKKMRE